MVLPPAEIVPAGVLPRANMVRGKGSWHGEAVDCVVLDFDDRHRRRMRMQGVRGLVFLLDLAEATALRGGDAVVLEDGAMVEIVAAPESLIEISSPDAGALVRIAWHLGNRHLPVQLAGRKLRIRRDQVIEAMVSGLGGTLREIEAPFDPESGAYAYAGHGHDQAHDHDLSHHNAHGAGHHHD